MTKKTENLIPETENKPLVSILVPCYNVEKYLPQCLDSIICQTLKDIESICLNDGSKDKTMQIIKEIREKDELKNKTYERYGYTVIRIWRSDFLDNENEVVKNISNILLENLD